jgi:hypothetical protein
MFNTDSNLTTKDTTQLVSKGYDKTQKKSHYGKDNRYNPIGDAPLQIQKKVQKVGSQITAAMEPSRTQKKITGEVIDLTNDYSQEISSTALSHLSLYQNRQTASSTAALKTLVVDDELPSKKDLKEFGFITLQNFTGNMNDVMKLLEPSTRDTPMPAILIERAKTLSPIQQGSK